MAGEVKWVLQAEESQAVGAFLRVVDAQKKGEQGFQRMKDEGVRLKEVVSGVGNEIKNMVAGFLGFEAGKELFKKVTEEIMAGREALIKFHEEMRGGATIGANLDNLPGFKSRSLALSSAYGVPIEQIAKFREQVAVKTSDLTEGKRQELENSALEYYHTTGQDPLRSAEAARKLIETHPGMSFKGAFNNIEFLRQKGGLFADEQLELGGMVDPSLAALNIPIDQRNAILAMSGKAGGKDSMVARGIKEALFKFGELADPNRHGGAVITHKGDLLAEFQDLEKLQEKDPEEFNKILGKRAAPAVSFVVQHPEMFKKLLAESREATGGDLIEEISKKQQADKETAMALRGAQTEQVEKNAPLTMGQTQQGWAENYAEKRAGYRNMAPTGLKWTAPIYAALPDFMSEGKMAREEAAIQRNRASMMSPAAAVELQNTRYEEARVRTGLTDTQDTALEAADRRARKAEKAGDLEGATAILKETLESFKEAAKSHEKTAAHLEEASKGVKDRNSQTE